jgi:hypothetical protein
MIRGRRGMTGYLRSGWIEAIDARVAEAPLAGGLNPALLYVGRDVNSHGNGYGISLTSRETLCYLYCGSQRHISALEWRPRPIGLK